MDMKTLGIRTEINMSQGMTEDMSTAYKEVRDFHNFLLKLHMDN